MRKLEVLEFEERFVENMALDIFGTDINPHTEDYETKFSNLLYDMIYSEVYEDYGTGVGTLSLSGKQTSEDKSIAEKRAEKKIADWIYKNKTDIDNQIMERVYQLEEEQYDIDVDEDLYDCEPEYEFDEFIDDYEDYLNY